MLAASNRLRKHADYQRVYKAGRKNFAKQVSFFFAVREPVKRHPGEGPLPPDPRVGLTVGKVMGKAVDRNRIKRRLREAARASVPILPPEVDVILHPRRSVLDLPFPALQREVRDVFRSVARNLQRPKQS